MEFGTRNSNKSEFKLMRGKSRHILTVALPTNRQEAASERLNFYYLLNDRNWLMKFQLMQLLRDI
jgi:hypothetical protein